MQCKTFTVLASEGLHARPAKALLTVVKRFQSAVTLEKGTAEADARSMLSILSLQATYRSELTVKTEGEDEVAAMEALTSFFQEEIMKLDA